MGKIKGFLRPLLLFAAVTTAAVLGFLGLKKRLNASPGTKFDLGTSSMNKLSKFFRSPVGIAATVIVVAVIAAGIFVLVKTQTAPKEPETAAIVNGEDIPYQDYKTRLDAQTYFYTEIDPRPAEELLEIQNQVLEDIIQERLLTQVLSEHGITVTDEKVREHIQETAVDSNFDGDWARYENVLNVHYQTTLKEVMRTVRLDFLKAEMAHLKNKKRVSAIWIEKNELQYVSYESMTEELKDQHIKINQEQLRRAELILTRVEGNEDLSVLAKEFSEDPETAKQGGDLGFLFTPTEAGEASQPSFDSFPGQSAVRQALQELEQGELKLYETFTGYAIVKITEVREAPLGMRSFDAWYPGFRKQAGVKILIELDKTGK